MNANTAIKLAGPVSYNDAMMLAREMYTTGEFIRSMRAYDRRHTEFAAHVRGLTERAVKLTFPYGTLEQRACMDEHTWKALREANLSATAVSPPSVRRNRKSRWRRTILTTSQIITESRASH